MNKWIRKTFLQIMVLGCEVDWILPDCEEEYHRIRLVKPTQKLQFVDFIMVP